MVFLLDALADCEIEPEDPAHTTLDLERCVLNQQIRNARTEIAAMDREYGTAGNNADQQQARMRGFEIAHGQLGKKFRAARARYSKLIAKRRRIPRRVEMRGLGERGVVRLAAERKHLTDIIKVVAYQSESDLLALPRLHCSAKTVQHCVAPCRAV